MGKRLTDDLGLLKKLVLIGASTGGPKALTDILAHLPRDLPAAVIVLQHMPAFFIDNFAKRLNAVTPLTVKVAEDEDRLEAGMVYIAPYGYDLMFKKMDAYAASYRLVLQKNTRAISSPCVDVAFKSAAKLFGRQTLGVILTGMGKDGVKGCKAIKSCNGRTMAQDESTSAVFGMPKSAIDAQTIDRILPLNSIAKAIIEEVRE